MSGLIKELDKWFSLYIRAKYADGNGFVKCYTCGSIHFWRRGRGTHIECGHFQKRKNKTLRFSEINCRPQCFKCNYELQGNDHEFENRLRAEIGDGMVNILKATKSQKLDKFLLSVKIDHYKSEFEKLRELKQLE